MVFKRVYVVPIILGIWFPVTFIITYIVAVTTDHVKPIIPYISDTGTWAPESCIFGIMLTIGGLLTIIVVYVRYRQVRDITEKFDFDASTRRMNTWTGYLGILSSFGCIIVANFQVTNVLSVHILGAGLCFGLATLYQIIQVILSFKLFPKVGNRCVNIYRAICACLCSISFVISCVTGLISILQFSGKDLRKWRKDEGGYDLHVVSAVTEYLMALLLVTFFITFTTEFKAVQFSEPELTVS